MTTYRPVKLRICRANCCNVKPYSSRYWIVTDSKGTIYSVNKETAFGMIATVKRPLT